MVKQMKETRETQKAAEAKERTIQQAVKMYQDGLEGPESSCPGLRAVCIVVERAVKVESGIEVKISHHTVQA